MKLIKIILNLMINRAGLRRYRLEIGTYFLKKAAAMK